MRAYFLKIGKEYLLDIIWNALAVFTLKLYFDKKIYSLFVHQKSLILTYKTVFLLVIISTYLNKSNGYCSLITY